jgi:hypothetical protein
VAVLCFQTPVAVLAYLVGSTSAAIISLFDFIFPLTNIVSSFIHHPAPGNFSVCPTSDQALEKEQPVPPRVSARTRQSSALGHALCKLSGHCSPILPIVQNHGGMHVQSELGPAYRHRSYHISCSYTTDGAQVHSKKLTERCGFRKAANGQRLTVYKRKSRSGALEVDQAMRNGGD